MPMGLSRSAMVILIAGYLLSVPARGSQGAEGCPGPANTPAGRVIEPSLRSLSISGPVSDSILSPSRIRRKAVLEETDPQIFEETDLGPVLIPGHHLGLMLSGPILHSLFWVPPLRC